MLSCRPKRISAPGESREGKVYEEWAKNASVFDLGLRFCHGRWKCSAFKNLVGALLRDGAGCRLSFGRIFKMEIPGLFYLAA